MENETVFGKIIRGEIPATKVYEDDKFLAFLDIKPVRKGHVLLIPKEKYTWIDDVPNKLLSESFIKAKEIILSMKNNLGCDYVQVVVEGIQVPHFHIHLIPSKYGVGNAKWNHLEYNLNEIDIFAEKIKSGLN